MAQIILAPRLGNTKDLCFPRPTSLMKRPAWADTQSIKESACKQDLLGNGVGRLCKRLNDARNVPCKNARNI